LQVANGGTGRTVLTTFGVLIGEGSNNVNVTAGGTSGQILIASTTGDPKFSTITSTGGTVTFTVGPNSVNIEVNVVGSTFFNPLQVANGGTGRTVLTTFGVLIGEGSNNVNVTAAGTSGQILIASTIGDPKFSTITSTGSTLTFTVGPNSVNIEVNVVGSTFFNPLRVPNGGTGRTVLTTFGVLIGEGSNNVNVTAAGTHGQVLIASTTGDPQFSTITSSGSTLAFTVGPDSLNIDINAPVQIRFGGSGRTVLTTFGVLIGEGSNNLNVTAAGTSGQLLIASTTGDPKFSMITSTGNTLTFTVGPNSLNIEVNVVGSTFFNPVQVPNGGTGRTVLTTFGVLIGEGSNNVNVTAAGTSGQILIASTIGDPKFSTITSTGGTVSFTVGPNSVNIEVNFVGSTFFNPVQVPNGGTGRTVLTTFGVLIGEGSNNINVTAPGTSGQILIASTTGDPKFATITSTGSTITFTVGPNSVNIEVNVIGSTFFNPLQVPNGGTGQTVLTTFGVLIGEGSNDVNVTAPGTSGQILIASTTGDPKFATITSTGSTITFTVGPNSVNIEVNVSGSTFFNPLQVRNGGTGRTVLTTFGVLIGEGSNNVNVTASGTSGQILIASTTGDPKFSTITSTGSTITFSVGPNSLNIEVNVSGSTFFNPLQVRNGGTGRTVLTTFGVLIGEGSNNVNVTASGTSGQILIASTTGDPKFSTITSSGNTMSFTIGPNSFNIDVVSPAIAWNNVTTSSVSAAINNGYLANNASLVTVILPSTASLFSSIAVAGWGTGGWQIAQNSGQSIQLGTQATTIGTDGFLASTNQYDSVNLLCTVADTNFLVLNSFGNISFN
ncbi:MAG: hypothetical protein Q8L68_01355, partial [Methylococcales bacterium]|nr:hypothetical protein [Methylococcales bacterium]